MALVITNTAMTGSEVSYTVPANTYNLGFQAVGGNIAMRHVATTGDPWTLVAANPFAVQDRNLPGTVFYMTGTSDVTLQVLRLTGTGS